MLLLLSLLNKILGSLIESAHHYHELGSRHNDSRFPLHRKLIAIRDCKIKA